MSKRFDPDWLPSLPDIELSVFRQAIETLNAYQLLEVEAHCREKRRLICLQFEEWSQIYAQSDWARWSVLVDACQDEEVSRRWKRAVWGAAV